MVDVTLSCRCGEIKGVAENVSISCGTRMVCYCDDCQSFASKLGQKASTLDANGGTEVFQLTQDKILISKGSEHIKCFRLTAAGLYRFYAGCCYSPIGNLKSDRVPLLSLIHNFVDPSVNRDSDMGPIKYRINGKYATNLPSANPIETGIPLMLKIRILPRYLVSVITGKRQPSVFFGNDGNPVSQPVIGTLDPLPATSGESPQEGADSNTET